MRAIDVFFEAVLGQLAEVMQTQRPGMEQAAAWVADALKQDGFVYVFGSGHSHSLGEELFYRAGGLARVSAILDPKLMVHESASGSSEWERREGYAETVLARYPLKEGDVLFVVSNSGRNAVPVEMAMAGAARGARVVAVVSRRYNAAFPSRHSSGKKLPDVAHLTLDNACEMGDGAVDLPGLPFKAGPTSTINSAFILHAIMVEAMSRLLAQGIRPEVFPSANRDATGQTVADLVAKYRGVIPHL